MLSGGGDSAGYREPAHTNIHTHSQREAHAQVPTSRSVSRHISTLSFTEGHKDMLVSLHIHSGTGTHVCTLTGTHDHTHTRKGISGHLLVCSPQAAQ